jgi:hypothetical protein
VLGDEINGLLLSVASHYRSPTLPPTAASSLQARERHDAPSACLVRLLQL